MQVYTLYFEFMKTILKSFEAFAGALCPLSRSYFNKQTLVLGFTISWMFVDHVLLNTHPYFLDFRDQF